MKTKIYISLSLSFILSGCASQVENALQHENQKTYQEGKIPYSEYRERDQYLDQFDEQFGNNKK